MKRSKWLILLCIVATLGLTGCSDEGDSILIGPRSPAQAEVAIEGVLDSAVDPLLLASEALANWVDSISKSSTRATCPGDNPFLCSAGTASCAPTELGWELTFSGCAAVGTTPSLVLDGVVEITPGGGPYFWLDMDNLSVNGSAGLNGRVTRVDECSSSWDVTSDGSSLTGAIIACPEQNPQSDSELLIRIQDASEWIIDFTFDGTSTATALVSIDLIPIASCSVDLDSYDATCSSV